MSVLPHWDQACRELAQRDETLGALIAEHAGDRLRGSGDGFRTLLNAVVGQQISVAAAAGIWARLLEAFPDPSPARLAAADRSELRALGLSWRKAEYVIGIAEAFESGAVDPARWSEYDDRAVRAELTALRGVGGWTADMILIFYLHRPDVLPLGDIGLVNAAARLYRAETIAETPAGERNGGEAAPGARTALRERQAWLEAHAERWRPWRTVATWYIWRDLDAEPVVY